MILVFYGHFVEKLYGLTHYAAAFAQYKLIYSFHMPLFFILAGYSFKNLDHLSFQQFMKNRVRARLLPWLFLNAASAPLWIGWHIAADTHIGFIRYLFAPIALLRGAPVYNALLWFIACLFSVEVIGFIYRHIFKTSTAAYLLVFVYLCWWIVTRNSVEFSKMFVVYREGSGSYMKRL